MLSRGVLDDKQIRAEGLRRANPEDYQKLLNEKYIKGVQVGSPAVISINAFYSSMAVNEFLARLHGNLRSSGNINHDSICFDMTEEQLYTNHISPEKKKDCPALSRHLGKGDVEPLLERSELTKTSK
ncbi:MAG: hypothetical protein NT118_05775 [Lentisphaerae bacterium]|nr:hypothetical protein [Lentisphaerota bacterium]